MLRAQSGDRDALDSLLESVQETLFGYISKLVGERALAEDILQEVFITIYRKLRWLREPELFRPWAFRIASRESFKRLKRERRWSAQVRDEAVLESIPALEAAEEFEPELAQHLPQLIARLSPASRAVLLLHYFEELSLGEIADVLGIAQGTVKSRLAYGLQSLRRAIREQANDGDREMKLKGESHV